MRNILTRGKFLFAVVLSGLITFEFERIARWVGLEVHHTSFYIFGMTFACVSAMIGITEKTKGLNKWHKVLWGLCGFVAIVSMVSSLVGFGQDFFEAIGVWWALGMGVLSLVLYFTKKPTPTDESEHG